MKLALTWVVGLLLAGRAVAVDPTWPSGGSGRRPAHLFPTDTVETVPARPPAKRLQPKTPSVDLGFDGIDSSFFGVNPPDPHIAVGSGAGAAGRVILITNAGIQMWDKNGNVLAGPLTLSDFFGTPGFIFDPKVLFDQHSGRFFAIALRGSTPNPGGDSNVEVAVSSSSAPSDLSAQWTFLSGSALTNIGGVETWIDYPGLGADADSLFVTGNLFDAGDGFHGAKIRVFDKAALLAGSYSFQDIDIAEGVYPGSGTIQPAHVFGATDSGNFYLVNRVDSSSYRLWEVSGDPAAPVLVASAMRPWAAGKMFAGGARQSGTSVTLDTVSGGVMNAVYRNAHLWLTLTSNRDNDSNSEIYWARIATNGGAPAAPSVADFGFVDGSDGDESVFMPAIAVNANGDATIIYTQSHSDQFPEMRYASRQVNDPPGTFQPSLVAFTSPGFFDSAGSGNPDRWGDYGAAVVDPDNDLTFWAGHEVVAVSAPDNSQWGTHIVRLGEFTCGNGLLDGGETCDDDGNVNGDGCSATCQTEPCYTCSGEPSACSPEPDGTLCDDGNPCTRSDQCQSQVCAGDASPLAGCRLPFVSGAAFLLLKDNPTATRDKLVWRWARGSATSLADFGDPLSTTSYALCLYDQSAGADVLEMGLEIPPGSRWEAINNGFRYTDSSLASDGVRKVVLRAGADGAAKIVVVGKGGGLDMTPLPPTQDPSVRVQISNGTRCWEATYGTFIKSEILVFKARAD